MPLPDPTRLSDQLKDAPRRVLAPPDARQAAVAIAIDWSDQAQRVLLMRRRKHAKDPWSGQVSLPGGHAEQADKDLFATAVREASEELAVDLELNARALGQLPPRQAMARGKRLDLWITACVFQVTAPLEPRPGPEAELAFWLPLELAASGDIDHRYHYKDERRELILPAWKFQKHTIWGLTFRMLSALLDDFGTAQDPGAKV